MSDDVTDVVAIGRIGPARGVRGDVFVEPWTDSPTERFAPGTSLLTEPGEAGPLSVEASSTAGGKLVVHFAGFDDRITVEQLRGVRLLLPTSQRPPLEDPDEFYDSDLLGLRAVHVDGHVLGDVVDVVHARGATYLVLHVDGQDRLVPFVAAIVTEVNLTRHSVTVDPPDGLFEL